MRWLIVQPGPNFSVDDVYQGWAEALTGIGEQVMRSQLDDRLVFFNTVMLGDQAAEPAEDGRRPVRQALTTEQAVGMASEWLLNECYRWWPRYVLIISCFFIPSFVLEVMKSRGHTIVMVLTEAPYQDGQQLEMAKWADVCLVNDYATLDEYKAVCPASVYQPHCYRPSVHFPARPRTRRRHDLTFVGTGFPSRCAFFEAMNLDGLDVALGGFWERLPPASPLRAHLLPGGTPASAEFTGDLGDVCVTNTDTAALYRASRTGINFYRREAETGRETLGQACGPREIEMAACGLWFTRDPRPESDALFPMLPSFTTPGEASDQIRWALTHPGKRRDAATAARAAIEDRTFSEAAKRLLRLLDTTPRR